MCHGTSTHCTTNNIHSQKQKTREKKSQHKLIDGFLSLFHFDEIQFKRRNSIPNCTFCIQNAICS